MSAAIDTIVRDLRDIATGRIWHRYGGSCPVTDAPDARADGCPACDILARADAILAGQASPFAGEASAVGTMIRTEDSPPPNPGEWFARADRGGIRVDAYEHEDKVVRGVWFKPRTGGMSHPDSFDGAIVSFAQMDVDELIGWSPSGPPLSMVFETAEREAYRAALARHGGSITDAARELDVSRVTASRAVERLGLRGWLDATWPHRDPATKGRKGERRRSRKPT